MAAPGSFTAGQVLTAAEMNALPGGIVTATSGGTSGAGYVLLNADFTFTTEVDVTGMTVTFTGVAGRLYRAAFDGLLEDQVNVFLNVAGSNVQRIQNAATNFVSCYGSIIFTATGSTVVKVRASSNDGTTNRIEAASFRPAVFVVEDIGPA